MRKIPLTFKAALASCAAVGLLLSMPLSASAAESDTISGYTEESFVAAAQAQGVDPAAAESAWGSEEAMRGIPGASVEEGGRDVPLTAGFAARANHSGSCAKSWTNAFGSAIVTVRITKTWSSSGSTVSNPAAQFYGTAGTPYVYDGQTNAQDYYNASKNIHTTYRQGKFTDNLSGYQINASATFDARPNGVYGCNFGGGPN